MPSECHVGFGILQQDVLFDALVWQDDGELYPDVWIQNPALRALTQYKDYDDDAAHELRSSGVLIGPLHVYETPEQGTAVEFCGAWWDYCTIEKAKLEYCLLEIEDLKEQGRLPKDAKLSSYMWN